MGGGGRDRRRRGDRESGEGQRKGQEEKKKEREGQRKGEEEKRRERGGQRKGQGKKEIEGNVSIVIAEVPTTWEEIIFYSSQKVVPKIKINFYF